MEYYQAYVVPDNTQNVIENNYYNLDEKHIDGSADFQAITSIISDMPLEYFENVTPHSETTGKQRNQANARERDRTQKYVFNLYYSYGKIA